jgi:hypothetical protein
MRKLVSVLLGATLISTIVYPINWARAENPNVVDHHSSKPKKQPAKKLKSKDSAKPVKMPEVTGWFEQTRGWVADHPIAITLGGGAFGSVIGAGIGLATTVGANIMEREKNPPTQNQQASDTGKNDKDVAKKKSQKPGENKKTEKETLPRQVYNKAKTEFLGYAHMAEKHPFITAMTVGAVAGGATLAVTRNPWVAAGVGVAAVGVTLSVASPTIRAAVKKAALEHPNIAAGVAGAVAGGITLAITGNPMAAVGVGAATAVVTRTALLALAPGKNAPKTPAKTKTGSPSGRAAKAGSPHDQTQATPPTTTGDPCIKFKSPPTDPKTFDCKCPIPLPPVVATSSENEEDSACAQLGQTAKKMGIDTEMPIVSASSAEGKNTSLINKKCASGLNGTDLKGTKKPATPPPATPDAWLAVRKFCAPTSATPDPILVKPSNGIVPVPVTDVSCPDGKPAPCGAPPTADKKKDDKGLNLPLKGMGLVGTYGGILGAMLLGPMGMFLFAIIGIGVGYLISK